MTEPTFLHKTKDGSSLQNKPKVFFTCHPDDFEKCFKQICQDIFEFQDCVVFYTEDMTQDLSDKNTCVDLERMNLFVIPVTIKTLITPNRAMDSDFHFALERHIPVLPIMIEPGIYDVYSRPDKFGDLQYLKTYSKSDTEVDYKNKLKNYLESVLISDELANRVRQAFDAYIFLSYRKKDRQYANSLIKMIHNNPQCENIAIWFDEFLIPGESFREGIDRILNDSKLFTLLVTPNLLERNGEEPNFIMREEYPKAKEMGKPILPTEMQATDRDALAAEFPGLPECVDYVDQESFNKRLLDVLTRTAIAENPNNTPEHDYLIGLAYLEGIDMEVDADRAVRLITKAAEADLPEAIEKLIDMYRNGIGVQRNYKKAQKWVKRWLYHLTRWIEEADEPLDNCIRRLLDVAYFFLDIGDYDDYIDGMYGAYTFGVNRLGRDNQFTLRAMSELALGYFYTEKYEKALELSIKCYDASCRHQGKESHDSIRYQTILARVYQSMNDTDRSISLYEECFELSSSVLGENDEVTLTIMASLAIAYCDKNEFDKSIELLKDCYQRCCNTFGETSDKSIDVLAKMARSYYRYDFYDKGIGLYQKCYEYYCDKYGKDHPKSIGTLQYIADGYFDNGGYQNAINLYDSVISFNRVLFGDDSPFIISPLLGLAKSYKEILEYEKSMSIYEQLYVVYFNNSKYDECVNILMNECYPLSCKVYGDKHENSISLLDCGRLVALYCDACKEEDKVRGEYNNYDLMKQVYTNQFDYYKRCYQLIKKHKNYRPEIYNKILDAISSFNVPGSLRRDPSAIYLLEECYKYKCEEFGRLNPGSIGSLEALSNFYYFNHDYEKAIELKSQCYADYVSVFGKADFNTLDCLEALAEMYSSIGEKQKLIECYNELFSIVDELDIDTDLYRWIKDQLKDYHYRMSCMRYGENHPISEMIMNKITELNQKESG